MYFTAILALCLAALGAAVPSPTHNDDHSDIADRGVVTFVMSEPDCPSLKDYCTHCNGDFNCETDPRCEWCYDHGGFGNSS
ncbi:hypothetical protein GGS21DRAFT_487343 [Xylaria nigripes]|nr:hypothetical protein GGS21DRAFT_487343 [Xylaria nigripes]